MRYGLPGVCLITAAVCVRLGVWQVSRLKERRALNAVLAARMAQVPVDLDGPLPDSMAWRRATAHGLYDFNHQIVLTNRTQQGLPGVWVVTPLRLPSGRVVLVERGWFYAPDGQSMNVQHQLEPQEASVQGMVVDAPSPSLGSATWPKDTVWPKAMRTLDLGYLTFAYAPVTAVLRRERLALPSSGEFQAIPLPTLDNGPHLSYAIQWFSFATIALVGGAMWLVRTRPRSLA